MSRSLIRTTGNLLIRPAPKSSRSPYNFEIVLLDHGLYFDLDDTLRLDYSKFWLSLIAPGTPEVRRERRKYASRVGNIGDDLVRIITLFTKIGSDHFVHSTLFSRLQLQVGASAIHAINLLTTILRPSRTQGLSVGRNIRGRNLGVQA